MCGPNATQAAQTPATLVPTSLEEEKGNFKVSEDKQEKEVKVNFKKSFFGNKVTKKCVQVERIAF